MCEVWLLGPVFCDSAAPGCSLACQLMQRSNAARERLAHMERCSTVLSRPLQRPCELQLASPCSKHAGTHGALHVRGAAGTVHAAAYPSLCGSCVLATTHDTQFQHYFLAVWFCISLIASNCCALLCLPLAPAAGTWMLWAAALT